MLDETPQTPGTPEVRAARPPIRRFSTAVRLTMMIPRTESEDSGHENKELSQEELFEARALAARYPSHFSILHPVFGLQPAGKLSASYGTGPNKPPLSLAQNPEALGTDGFRKAKSRRSCGHSANLCAR
jgi:hypothetical protein